MEKNKPMYFVNGLIIKPVVLLVSFNMNAVLVASLNYNLIKMKKNALLPNYVYVYIYRTIIEIILHIHSIKITKRQSNIGNLLLSTDKYVLHFFTQYSRRQQYNWVFRCLAKLYIKVRVTNIVTLKSFLISSKTHKIKRSHYAFCSPGNTIMLKQVFRGLMIT